LREVTLICEQSVSISSTKMNCHKTVDLDEAVPRRGRSPFLLITTGLACLTGMRKVILVLDVVTPIDEGRSICFLLLTIVLASRNRKQIEKKVQALILKDFRAVLTIRSASTSTTRDPALHPRNSWKSTPGSFTELDTKARKKVLDSISPRHIIVPEGPIPPWPPAADSARRGPHLLQEPHTSGISSSTVASRASLLSPCRKFPTYAYQFNVVLLSWLMPWPGPMPPNRRRH
jgi:hypothetical protein